MECARRGTSALRQVRSWCTGRRSDPSQTQIGPVIHTLQVSPAYSSRAHCPGPNPDPNPSPHLHSDPNSPPPSPTSDDTLAHVLAGRGDGTLAPIRYVGPDKVRATAAAYPHNPNGSPEGIAALCSPCGRHLAMMPHPERCWLGWQVRGAGVGGSRGWEVKGLSP